MSIDAHVVFAIANIRRDWGVIFAHAYANGLVRGFCIVGPVPKGASICKFTMDATSERCVEVIGCPGLFWPIAGLHRISWDSAIDGMRGRTY